MLAAAVAAGLALAATLLLFPQAPWRLPLALAGGLWAPGDALACALWPRGRLSALERHALAVGLGLLLAPLAGLLASALAGFRPSTVGGTLAVLTCAAAAVALHRRGDAPEAASWSSPPSRRATLATGGAALCVAALVAVPAWVPAEALPSSLALEGDIPRTVIRNATLEVALVARAGDAPVDAPLVVTWNGEVLWTRNVSLAPHAEARLPLPVAPDGAGAHVREAAWGGRLIRVPREVTRR
jgi:hypothetical protein